MSIMAMKRFVEKFGAWVVGILAVPLLIGIVYSGMGRNIGNNGPSEAQRRDAETPIAKIGDANITRTQLDRAIEQASRGGMLPPPQPDVMDMYRLILLDQFKQQQAAVAAAKSAGVNVTDADMAAGRDRVWNEGLRATIAQQLGLSATASDRDVEAALQKQVNPNATLDQFKASLIDDDRLKVQLYQTGLRDKLRAEVKVDEDMVRRSTDEIQVRHILIKSGEGGLPDAQAKAKAEKILAEVLKDPAKMPALAKANSDDGNKAQGGFYDWQPGAKYVPEFTEGALKAGVGKVYPELVKTTYGYHIIKLEGERPAKDGPKDWPKEKQRYIDSYVDRQLGSKLGDLVKAAEPSLTVEILDPGLRAAKLVREASGANKEAKLAEALAELGKIPASADPLGAVPMRKASIYEILGKSAEAVAAYEEALKARNLPETRFKLAEAYVKQKDDAKVKAQLEEIAKLPLPDPSQWKQLADLYTKVGDKDNARKALEKNQELTRRQLELLKEQAAARAAAMPPTPAPSPTPAAKK